MTEYVIIVGLIAIAAVGVYTSLGKTVRSQTAAAVNGLVGKEAEGKKLNDRAVNAALAAETDANLERGLENFATGTKKQ